MTAKNQLLNYINGQWQRSGTDDYLPVTNPANAQTINEFPSRREPKLNVLPRLRLKHFKNGDAPQLPNVFNSCSNC